VEAWFVFFELKLWKLWQFLLEADLEAVADFFMVDGDSENLFGTVVNFQGKLVLVDIDWRTVKSKFIRNSRMKYFVEEATPNFYKCRQMQVHSNRFPQYVYAVVGECVHVLPTSSGYSYNTPHMYTQFPKLFPK